MPFSQEVLSEVLRRGEKERQEEERIESLKTEMVEIYRTKGVTPREFCKSYHRSRRLDIANLFIFGLFVLSLFLGLPILVGVLALVLLTFAFWASYTGAELPSTMSRACVRAEDELRIGEEPDGRSGGST